MKSPFSHRRGAAPRARRESSSAPDPPLVVPVAREEIRVLRRKRTTGTVRITKTIGQRVEVINDPIVHEDVVVERVATDRVVDTPPPPRHEGETLVVSVVAEVLVKQLRVVEEVRITRRRRVERRRTTVSLLTEHVDVERRGITPPASEARHGARRADRNHDQAT